MLGVMTGRSNDGECRWMFAGDDRVDALEADASPVVTHKRTSVTMPAARRAHSAVSLFMKTEL